MPLVAVGSLTYWMACRPVDLWGVGPAADRGAALVVGMGHSLGHVNGLRTAVMGGEQFDG